MTEQPRDEKQIAHQQYQAMLKAKKQLVLSDFWEFTVEVLGQTNLMPFHQQLCNFTQKNMDKKRLILLPRGHLKSTIVTVGYTLWRLAQDPGLRILIANATAPMAEAFLRQIKANMQRNEHFIELFGNYYDKSEKWSDVAIRLKTIKSHESKENTITAFGIGGNLVSQHYDIMIFDDLVNRDNIHTAERMQDVMTFYKDAQDLVDDPMKTEQLMIGTRWHEADLYGHILDPNNPEHEEWTVMKREAVEGDYEIQKADSGRYQIVGGTVLYPTKYPREAHNKLLNAKGITEYSAQYLNDPVPSDQATFRHEYKYYEPNDLKGVDMLTFITIDPAFYDPHMKTADPDYTGIIVNRVNAHNDWFIWDIIRDRFTPQELIEMMFNLDTHYKPQTFGLEATAWQKILGYVAREQMKKRNHFLNITELQHSGRNAKSKFDRIQALEPRYAVGSIWHNPNIRHMSTLEQELRRFPRAKTDDLADALANQLEVAHPPRRRSQRSGNERSFMDIYPA